MTQSLCAKDGETRQPVDDHREDVTAAGRPGMQDRCASAEADTPAAREFTFAPSRR